MRVCCNARACLSGDRRAGAFALNAGPADGADDAGVSSSLPLRCWNGRHAEGDGRDAGESLCLFAFLAEEGEGEVEAFDFAEPALVGGSASAGLEVVFDLVEAWQHLGVDVEHGQRKHECSCWQGVP